MIVLEPILMAKNAQADSDEVGENIELQDDLRAARGVFVSLCLSLLLWLAIGLIIWMV